MHQFQGLAFIFVHKLWTFYFQTVILLFPWFWGQFSTTSTLSNWSLLFHLGHILSLASTSFIEEEHQTAYFLAISINLLILYQLLCKQANLDKKQAYLDQSHPNQDLQRYTNEDLKRANPSVSHHTKSNNKRLSSAVFKSLVLMGILKIARCWNQTGDKWGHLVIIFLGFFVQSVLCPTIRLFNIIESQTWWTNSQINHFA